MDVELPPMDVEFPAIYCPFPFKVHPSVERITQESLAWADQVGIYPSERYRQMFHRARFSWWHGVITPDADEERILPFAKFLLLQGSIPEAWSPHWAGHPGKLADFVARVGYTLEVPNAKVLTNFPHLMRGWEEVVSQLQKLATPNQYRRWLECVLSDLNSLVRENWIIAEKKVLDVNEYLPLRMRTMQMTPYFFSNDIVYGRDVPDYLFDHPAVRALHQLVLVHLGVRNDARDYRRDASEGQCNVIPCLMRDTGCSETEAIARTVGILDTVMYRCVQLHRRMEKGKMPDAMREHLADVLGFTRATIAYEQHVRHGWYQYHGDMSQEFAGSPSSVDPLPYSSVAWCWNV